MLFLLISGSIVRLALEDTSERISREFKESRRETGMLACRELNNAARQHHDS